MADFQIGQEMVVVITLNTRGDPKISKQEITKIGKKWITLGGWARPLRFDKDTFCLDGNGYSSPGKVYLSEEDYQKEVEREKVWNQFHNMIRSTFIPPKHVTTDEIKWLIARFQPEKPETGR